MKQIDSEWAQKLPMNYQTEFLDNWSMPECAVQDNKGCHCKDKVEHYVEFNGVRVGLCKRCYQNYRSGAFDCLAQRKLVRMYEPTLA